jgi:deazaflavin-dependent oxidoreductase (nitroreductase family)
MNADAAAAVRKWVADHLKTYVDSDGAEGHLVDYSVMGAGYANTPTLLLKTIGRRTHKESIAPLIYGRWKSDFVIVASKGGAAENPGWYYNLVAQPQVQFQAAREKFKAIAHEAQEPERSLIWDYMLALFPTYDDYQRATPRKIPIVLLTPTQRIETAWTTQGCGEPRSEAVAK